jgi:hypothetical protein
MNGAVGQYWQYHRLVMFQFIRNRRPSVMGLIVGGTAGLVTAVAYAATSAWLCSGIRACPASWEPYAVVSAIIFVLITFAGVAVAVVGATLYRIFDTALVVEDVVTTYPEGASATFPERSDASR